MKKPHICFAGNMLGKNAGFVTTQGQIVAELLEADGCRITCLSSRINRAARLAEIAAVLTFKHRRFDAVVVEVYSGLSFIIAETVAFLCAIFRLPLVMVLHGGNLPDFIGKYPRRMKRTFRQARFLIAPSEFLAGKIGERGFEVRVIPNVVNLENFAFRRRSRIAPKLIWMRSFHAIYNPQMAVETLAELRKDYADATLVMAGRDKGLELNTKKLAEKLGISGAVRFVGFLNDREKSREFAAADIYLNTNRIDNMPVSVVEACAAGLPVVATRVGGVPFLIADGENGLLCPSENVAEMVACVKKLLNNAELTAKISENARLLAERSAWTTVKNDWENLFGEIFRGASPARSSELAGTDLMIEKTIEKASLR